MANPETVLDFKQWGKSGECACRRLLRVLLTCSPVHLFTCTPISNTFEATTSILFAARIFPARPTIFAGVWNDSGMGWK